MKKTLLLVLLAFLVTVQTHAQGRLWGLSTYAGQDGIGAIFRTNADGTGLVYEKDFLFENVGADPIGGLVQAGNGKLYGVTGSGGPDGHGILFEYDPTTNNYTKQFQFNSTSGTGPRGSLLVSNNKLYGTTETGGASGFGVLFSFDPATGIYSKIIEFNGTNGKHPYGSLTVGSNGKFYGITNAGGSNNQGVLFEFDPVAVIYSTKLSFSVTTGYQPFGSLVSAGNGKLYGVTITGGAGGDGVLFEYDPVTSIYTKKYEFTVNNTNGAYPFEGLTLAGNNKLYGATTGGGLGFGVLYEFDPAGAGTYTKKIDFTGTNGESPYGRMALASNNKLYGMTEYGGIEGKGVLYEYDPATNTYSKKLDFTGVSNGASSRCGFLKIGNGKLYGMTTSGGAANKGVLFEFDPTTSTYTKKLDFNNPGNGKEPIGSLVKASNNKLYGTTRYGGASNYGVLFEFDPLTLELTKKVDFNGSENGHTPLSLVRASSGKFYGVTSSGGSNDRGVLFEYDPVTNVYTKKFDFSEYPTGLTLGSNNNLYGMLSNDGAISFGALFEYNLSTNTYTKKIDFAGGAAGKDPLGNLLLSSNGKFYGIMYQGGTSNFGVLFEYDPTSNTYTKKVDFNGTNGRNPQNGLTEGSNGKLYGMTYAGGTSSKGVLFEYDPASGVLTKKLDFAGSTNGAFPYGSLTLSGNNKLYGMTSSGGSSDAGVLFEYDPTTNTYTKKIDFVNDYPESTLFFEKANQIITFDALASKTTIDAAFSLTATATSSLSVSYTSSNPAVATVSGNTVTIVGAGTTTITASQAGNASYNAAPDVVQTLTVNKADQTITFASLPDKALGDTPFALSATSTSSLAVSFSTASDKITIVGNQVTIVKAGRATITAAQTGNAIYNAAVSVDRSFCIKPVKPTITLSNNNTESPTLTSSSSIGNQWFLNGAPIAGATNATINVTTPGVYQVQVKVDDCVSDLSSEVAIIVTGDIPSLDPAIGIFPNPATERLTVQFGDTKGTKSVTLYKLDGKQMDAHETTSNEAEFSVANYSTGVYIMRVKTETGMKVMRFVKN